MSAPPLLRPLRAILQRRLQIVSSRPIQTPYYLRASQYRSQLRCYSSIPLDQQPPKPEESTQEPPSEQPTENEFTSTTTQSANTASPAGSPSVPELEVEVEAEANVVTNFDISGRDAIHDAAIPRLDTLLVQSTFQQLKSADEEIKAGIAEAVARQLAVDAATTVHVGDAAAEFEGDEADAPVPVVSELPIRENAGAMDNQPGTISRETDSASLPEAEPFAAVEEVNRPIVSEPAGQAAEPDVAEQQEVIISETTTSGEAISQELFQEAASLPEEIPDSAASQQAAMPGLEALRHASPEQIAAMMAYLQTLQASKSPEANAETAISQVAAEQQTKSEESFPEATTPSSLAAEAVATMTESAEPTQPEKSETLQQTATESPALDRAPTKDAILEPAEVESDFVVDPIPDTLSPEEEAIVAMTQELEQLPKVVEEVTEAEPELPFVPESLENAAVADAPEQTETLESSVTAVPSVEESANEALTSDYSLDSVRDEELERRDQQEFAEELAENEDVKAAAFGEAGEDPLGETLEPSRIPRNVAAYYLQPLRRVAEYGVPACDLQLRSYSVRPLESFCDFALRAAYYLGLPAYGPVPLPKIIERWTVPKSSFIFKKSQENFERITRRRLIQIKDAHPETVQIWLAFLQKHQQAAVGMKANIWEFSSIDVAKQMEEASKEAEPLINDKYRLLQQNREFESVEKVDEFLQAERYRVTGDQVLRGQ